MKYLILHVEGLIDVPSPELGGRTPLQKAATPNMDSLVGSGELGRISIPGESQAHTREMAPLGLLGYDPRKYHTGPAPFEAVGIGVSLGEQDVTFRCDMVTLRPPTLSSSPQKEGPAYPEIKKLSPPLILDDETAGGIATEEARELIDAINEQLGSETLQFYPGSGHRHFMVWVGGKTKVACTDPRLMVGHPIGEFLPCGDGADILRKLMEASLIILNTHPVNDQRLDEGLKPANCLWFCGPGKLPKLAKLEDRLHISGTVLSGNNLVRGIGVCAGLDAVEPDEFSEESQMDRGRQVARAIREFEKKDFVYLHITFPCLQDGAVNPQSKCEMVEEFDRKQVGTILEALKHMGPYKVLLVGESQARMEKPIESGWWGIYALSQGTGRMGSSGMGGFNESDAEKANGGVRDMTKLAARLFAQGSG